MIICPKCGKELDKNLDNFNCKNCSTVYYNDNGIYRFYENAALEAENNQEFFPQEALDRLYRYEEVHFWHKARKEIIKRFFDRYVPKESKILEVGCGNGDVTAYLKKNYWNIDCGDIYMNGLTYCKKRCGEGNYYQFNLCYPIFNKEYDCICAFDVIEHINDDVAILKNLNKALKDDGILMITVPADMQLWSGDDVYMDHKRRYSKKELVEKFRKQGFNIINVNYFNTFLYPGLYMYRQINKRYEKNNNKKRMSSEIKINPITNRILYNIFYMESFITDKVPTPFGSSLICVAKKIPEKIETK